MMYDNDLNKIEELFTYDGGKERQERWRKMCKEEWDPSSLRKIEDKELLNWLSMYFNISRKIIKTQVI